MEMQEFNKLSKHTILRIAGSSELKTKQEWLQAYILENEERWDSPADLIASLHNFDFVACDN